MKKPKRLENIISVSGHTAIVIDWQHNNQFIAAAPYGNRTHWHRVSIRELRPVEAQISFAGLVFIEGKK